MPLFHIHGLVACLLASLHAGASVVCTAGFEPQTFLADCGSASVQLVLRGTDHPSSRPRVRPAAQSGGCVADRAAVRPVVVVVAAAVGDGTARGQQFGVPVIEAYGMTEAAHQMASNQLPPGGRRPGSVGTASGPEVSVTDSEGNHLPSGVVGELVIRGDSIMSGYLSPPEANDDAFFGDWFRTGDQGTIDEDGVVTLTGRLKELINRAGEKIAPREVDEALVADDEVSEALAFALPHPTLGEDVAAVVVPIDPDVFDASGVLDRLRTRLSDHKIPRRLIVVDELPKGATGKPARIGLAEKLGLGSPAPAPAPTTPTGRSAESTDPLVAAAAAVMRSVLGLPAIGPDDDFVAVGGDSLSALACAIALEDAFGVEIPAGMLLGPAGSPTTLAAAVRSERERDVSADIEPESLSGAARRLWTMQQIEPSSTAYNVGIAVRLQGSFGGPKAIDDAMQRLVDRHPALRTLITLEGGEVRASTAAPALTIERREIAPEQISDFVAEVFDRPIDLGLTPLHGGVACIEEDDLVAVLVTHHALVDGPSRQILRRDLVDLVEHRQLPDVVEAARRPVRRRETSTDFWRTELSEVPASPDLPAPTQSSKPGVEQSSTTVSGLALDDLRKLARSRGATLFSVLLAAHAEALRRVGGQDDVVIALPVTSRPPSDDTTVGMYIETIPVRVRLGDITSVEALLSESQRAVTQALAHSDVPFDELIELASLQRSATARPLAGTMCQLRPPVPSDKGPTGFSMEDLDAAPSEARFDIAVDFIDRTDSLEIVVEHDRMAIDDEHGRRHAVRIARVLEGFITASALATIDICADDERTLLDQIGRGDHHNEPESLDLVATLDAMAADDPQATAIIDDDQTTTRAGLIARSRAFAAAFDEVGASETRPVGIALPRGADAIAAMIGAWRVGAPYVTFDSSGPTERDRAVIERCDAAVVLARTSGWIAPTIDPVDVGDDKNGWRANRRASTAWIISTSGSTGEPKLVPGSMVGLVNRLLWGQRTIPVIGPAAHRTPLVFGDHPVEIFQPLLAGQPLVIIDDETVRDPRGFARVIETNRVTRLVVVPTLLRMLVAGLGDGKQLASLETVVTSGEPLTLDVAENWKGFLPGARLINVYGSTEVGADASAGEVKADGQVTVGTPIDGYRIQVVSSSGARSPHGCIGEIWVSGVGVMDGYLDRDSGQSLVERDLDGEMRIWYRTGDRGRFDPAGCLNVVGRADKQLKVRGVRLDPLEIENALRAATGAFDAAVFVHDDTLSAVLVGLSRLDFDPRSVQQALAEVVPPTHIPTRIQVVDELPRTASGKLNRSALSAASPPKPPPPRLPGSPTEQWLSEQWAELIPGTDCLSVDDDFFSIGGQSLTAVELFVRIEQEFRVDLPVSVIFDASTIRTLATSVENAYTMRPSRMRNWFGKTSPTTEQQSGVREISAGITGAPTVVWCLPGDPVELHELRGHLGAGIRLIALETPGRYRGERPIETIEGIAAHHARTMTSLSPPTGVLAIGGYSFGGLVACELARRLQEAGLDPQLLVMVDTRAPSARPPAASSDTIGRLLNATWRPTLWCVRRFARHPRTHSWSSVLDPYRKARWQRAKRSAAARFTDVDPLGTATLLFTTSQWRKRTGQRDLGWNTTINGSLEVVEIEGTHGGLLRGDPARIIGEKLRGRLFEG